MLDVYSLTILIFGESIDGHSGGMLVVSNIICDVYCLYELRKSINDIREIVKWIEFVKPSVNSIKKKKKSVNWALKFLVNVAREETMIEHEAR